jgi:WS/DGAT/MGAT family acyltransferase
VTLPEPGSDEQLRHLASEFFAEPLDRERPLWQILLVQGLTGGRTAQIVKAHHCLVDGVGGVQLLVALLDTEPQTAPRTREAKQQPAPLPGPVERLSDGLYDQLRDQIDLTESVALTLLDPASAVRWGRSVARALGAAQPYLVRRAPDTPWNTTLSGPRQLGWQELPLAESRAICTALGGKVNNLILTVLAGALRRYFLLHGWETEGVVLRVAVPVNVRTDDEARALGNHVSIMLAGLPLDVADPRARFRAISREIKELKAVDQAGGIENLLRVLGRLPAPVQAALGKRMTAPNIFANLICTNVRGPETPLYCLGHEMVAHYPWVLTTWRMGLGVAVMSYMGSLWFSFTGDASVLRDVERVAEFLAEDFRELHASAVKQNRVAKQVRPASATARQERAPVAAAPRGPQPASGQNGTGELRGDSRVGPTDAEAGEGQRA